MHVMGRQVLSATLLSAIVNCMYGTLIDRLVEPFAECLTRESAAKVIALRADDSLQCRVDELADKANAGTLTPDECAEYDRILAAFHFVTVMQARAHRLLKVL